MALDRLEAAEKETIHASLSSRGESGFAPDEMWRRWAGAEPSGPTPESSLFYILSIGLINLYRQTSPGRAAIVGVRDPSVRPRAL